MKPTILRRRRGHKCNHARLSAQVRSAVGSGLTIGRCGEIGYSLWIDSIGFRESGLTTSIGDLLYRNSMRPLNIGNFSCMIDNKTFVRANN